MEGLASVQKVGMMEGYRGGNPGTVSADCNQDFEVYPKMRIKRQKVFANANHHVDPHILVSTRSISAQEDFNMGQIPPHFSGDLPDVKYTHIYLQNKGPKSMLGCIRNAHRSE